MYRKNETAAIDELELHDSGVIATLQWCVSCMTVVCQLDDSGVSVA